MKRCGKADFFKKVKNRLKKMILNLGEQKVKVGSVV
jgi:hypothetical protein